MCCAESDSPGIWGWEEGVIENGEGGVRKQKAKNETFTN